MFTWAALRFNLLLFKRNKFLEVDFLGHMQNFKAGIAEIFHHNFDRRPQMQM